MNNLKNKVIALIASSCNTSNKATKKSFLEKIVERNAKATLHAVINDIEKILAETDNEDEIFAKLRQFLTDRWQSICNTAFCYTAFPEYSANQFCYEIAKLLHEKDNNTLIYQFLMPSLTVVIDKFEMFDEENIDQFPLGTFILSDNVDSIIPFNYLSHCPTPLIDISNFWKNPYTALDLTESEKVRLKFSSLITKHFFELTDGIQYITHSESIGGKLKQLIAALREGGASRAGTGMNASVEALNGIREFFNYWQTLPAFLQEKYRTSRYEDKTLGQILDILQGGEKAAKAAHLLSCVEVNASILENILLSNREELYSESKYITYLLNEWCQARDDLKKEKINDINVEIIFIYVSKYLEQYKNLPQQLSAHLQSILCAFARENEKIINEINKVISKYEVYSDVLLSIISDVIETDFALVYTFKSLPKKNHHHLIIKLFSDGEWFSIQNINTLSDLSLLLAIENFSLLLNLIGCTTFISPSSFASILKKIDFTNWKLLISSLDQVVIDNIFKNGNDLAFVIREIKWEYLGWPNFDDAIIGLIHLFTSDKLQAIVKSGVELTNILNELKKLQELGGRNLTNEFIKSLGDKIIKLIETPEQLLIVLKEINENSLINFLETIGKKCINVIKNGHDLSIFLKGFRHYGDKRNYIYKFLFENVKNIFKNIDELVEVVERLPFLRDVVNFLSIYFQDNPDEVYKLIKNSRDMAFFLDSIWGEGKVKLINFLGGIQRISGVINNGYDLVEILNTVSDINKFNTFKIKNPFIDLLGDEFIKEKIHNAEQLAMLLTSYPGFFKKLGGEYIASKITNGEELCWILSVMDKEKHLDFIEVHMKETLYLKITNIEEFALVWRVLQANDRRVFLNKYLQNNYSSILASGKLSVVLESFSSALRGEFLQFINDDLLLAIPNGDKLAEVMRECRPATRFHFINSIKIEFICNIMQNDNQLSVVLGMLPSSLCEQVIYSCDDNLVLNRQKKNILTYINEFHALYGNSFQLQKLLAVKNKILNHSDATQCHLDNYLREIIEIVGEHQDKGLVGFLKGNFIRNPETLNNFNTFFNKQKSDNNNFLTQTIRQSKP